MSCTHFFGTLRLPSRSDLVSCAALKTVQQALSWVHSQPPTAPLPVPVVSGKAQRGSQALRAELVLLLFLPLPCGFGSLVEEPVKVFFDDGLVILQRCRHHVCV